MLDDAPSRRERFVKALDLVDAADDLAGLKRAIDALRAPYGLSNAAFVAFARPGAASSHDTVLLTYPPEWIEHYFRQRYDRIDPVLRAARSLTPVDWDALDWSAPVTTRFREESREAGVGLRGLALPSHGPGDARAMLVVTADVPGRDWRPHSLDLMRDMGVVASQLHAKLLTLQSAEPHRPASGGTVALSGRERETLQWAAAGKTIDQTAFLLELSSSAVRTYLDTARRKLGCSTKPQAVAVAMRRGLIEG